MSKRILTVFGTRPEAIKMAPVVKAIAASNDLEGLVAVTAQHRQMLDQVLDLFEIKPDFDLDIMQANQDLFDVTSRALLGLRAVIREARPDVVLVHGDTTTCFAAGLAAFYLQVPVGHVEAGLRTGDLTAPFPEEANRSLVARLTRHHFAPTERAKQNLLKENIPEAHIRVTGNTVIDALLDVKARLPNYDMHYWKSRIPVASVDAVLNGSGKFILITGHRRENFGQGFQDFCNALRRLATSHPEWLLIYPVHLNPNVQKPVYEMLADLPNIQLIEPLDYLPFVWLLDQCDLVITDSGGIQEEAPSLGKPVIVTRAVTERPEAVEAGTVVLTGTATDCIVDNVEGILGNPSRLEMMTRAHNPYGDGMASARIVKELCN